MNDFKINPEYKETDDIFKSRLDMKTTQASIKEMLKDGTPDWFRFPKDYKDFVKESFAAEKEISNGMVAQYRDPDQEILTDDKARMVNILTTLEFYKRLKDNGVRCFTVDNNWPGTCALWCVPRYQNEFKYIAYMQLPCMYEFSVLDLDKHGLSAGESYRGWRTVLAQLILKEVLTEEQAHKIYGYPSGAASVLYQRTLKNFRDGIGRKSVGSSKL